MNRHLILSITFQRTHYQVPAAAPARNNTVETQRPEQQSKGEVAWEQPGPCCTGAGRAGGHLWCLAPVTCALLWAMWTES